MLKLSTWDILYIIYTLKYIIQNSCHVIVKSKIESCEFYVIDVNKLLLCTIKNIIKNYT